MKKYIICLCGIILSTLYLVFWGISFVGFPSYSVRMIHLVKWLEGIKIIFLVIMWLLFGLVFKLSFNVLINDNSQNSSKLDFLLCGTLFLVFVSVILFEILFACYCNINAHYLSNEETIRFIHIPLLFLGDCIAWFSCYTIYQFQHNL